MLHGITTGGHYEIYTSVSYYYVDFICRRIIEFLPLPIPASVYGLLIMLVGLYTKMIPLSAIEDVADWLILIMPVLFVPSAVGLMNVKKNYLKT